MSNEAGELIECIKERGAVEKFKNRLLELNFSSASFYGTDDFSYRKLQVRAFAPYTMLNGDYLAALETISKATFNGWKVASLERKDHAPPNADEWAEEHIFTLIYSPVVVEPNPNRLPLDEAYMQMAEVWAKRSKSNRAQVGALVVKDTRIISDGYNGLPSGEEPDVCEDYDYSTDELVTKPEVLHAESNAILKLAKYGGGTAQGATLYVTLSPCKNCAKLIHQAGIARVVYRNSYRNPEGIEHLEKRGVIVEQLTKDEDDDA